MSYSSATFPRLLVRRVGKRLCAPFDRKRQPAKRRVQRQDRARRWLQRKQSISGQQHEADARPRREYVVVRLQLELQLVECAGNNRGLHG